MSQADEEYNPTQDEIAAGAPPKTWTSEMSPPADSYYSNDAAGLAKARADLIAWGGAPDLVKQIDAGSLDMSGLTQALYNMRWTTSNPANTYPLDQILYRSNLASKSYSSIPWTDFPFDSLPATVDALAKYALPAIILGGAGLAADGFGGAAAGAAGAASGTGGGAAAGGGLLSNAGALSTAALTSGITAPTLASVSAGLPAAAGVAGAAGAGGGILSNAGNIMASNLAGGITAPTLSQAGSGLGLLSNAGALSTAGLTSGITSPTLAQVSSGIGPGGIFGTGITGSQLLNAARLGYIGSQLLGGGSSGGSGGSGGGSNYQSPPLLTAETTRPIAPTMMPQLGGQYGGRFGPTHPMTQQIASLLSGTAGPGLPISGTNPAGAYGVPMSGILSGLLGAAGTPVRSMTI